MIHHKFIQSFPVEINAFRTYQEQLNKGFAYVYKRDKAFRPICIINVHKLAKTKIDFDTMIHLATYMV